MSCFETDPPSTLDRADFVARFGSIYEHSPWVAETVWDSGRVPDDAEALAETMAAVVEQAGEAAQLALLRAHPDLAGKLAAAGVLSPESTAEQAGAGLDRCTPEAFLEFRRLNEAYKARFGFPFIVAVRDRDRAEILELFRDRLQNDAATEFREALNQVHRIALHRLLALAGRP